MRLAVHSSEEAVRRDLAPRLRGATVVASGDWRPPAAPAAYDAAAFVGPGRPEPGVVEQVLSAGKHVLVATEVCLPRDDTERLSDAARANGVRFAAVNPEHYLPSRQLLRQQLDAGKLGEAVLVRFHCWEPPARERVPEKGQLPGPLVQAFDLTLWLLGKSLEVVYAVGQLADAGGGLPGCFVQVHLGFAGGAMTLIDYSNRLPPGDGYRSLSVIGTAGAAYADDHQNVQLVYRGGHPQAARTDEGTGHLAVMVQEFVDALRAGDHTPEGAAGWRNVWNVAEAVRRSLEAGRAVSPEGG